MELREKVELALIPLAAVAAFQAAELGLLPASLAFGEVVMAAAAGLLGQGLIRDLHLKYVARHEPEAACALTPGAPRGAAMCMESVIGMALICFGALLLFSGDTRPVALDAGRWGFGVAALGLAGFLLKDVVIDFRTRGLRIEKAHRNVVFW